MPRWEKEKSKERDGARRSLPLLFSFVITFEIKPKLRKGSILPAPGSAGRSYTFTVTEAGHGTRSCTFPQGTSHSRRGDRQLVQAHAAHHAHALKTFELLLPLDEKKHFFRARNLWCPLLSAWFHDCWSRNPLDPKLQVPQRDSWTLVAFTWLSFSVCWAPHTTQAPEGGLWDPTTNTQRSAVFLYTVNKQSI